MQSDGGKLTCIFACFESSFFSKSILLTHFATKLLEVMPHSGEVSNVR
jgi:hypothetical protein